MCNENSSVNLYACVYRRVEIRSVFDPCAAAVFDVDSLVCRGKKNKKQIHNILNLSSKQKKRRVIVMLLGFGAERVINAFSEKTIIIHARGVHVHCKDQTDVAREIRDIYRVCSIVVHIA